MSYTFVTKVLKRHITCVVEVRIDFAPQCYVCTHSSSLVFLWCTPEGTAEKYGGKKLGKSRASPSSSVVTSFRDVTVVIIAAVVRTPSLSAASGPSVCDIRSVALPPGVTTWVVRNSNHALK